MERSNVCQDGFGERNVLHTSIGSTRVQLGARRDSSHMDSRDVFCLDGALKMWDYAIEKRNGRDSPILSTMIPLIAIKASTNLHLDGMTLLPTCTSCHVIARRKTTFKKQGIRNMEKSNVC